MVAIPIAGARRTGSAYERFVQASDVAAAVVDGGDDSGAFLAAVAAIPGVDESARVGGMQPTLIGPPGNVRPPPPGAQLGLADAQFGTAVSRHVVIDGALANPDRLEVVVTEEWADRFGTRVGDEIALTLPNDEVIHEQLPFEDLARRIATDPSASRTITARVTGVVLLATQVAPDDQDRTAALIASPAIARQLGFPTEIAQGLMHVILSPDTDVARFREEVEALRRQLETSDDSIALTVVEDLSAGRARVERALGPHVTVLWVIAALAALLAVVVVVPAVLRQIAVHRHEDEVLVALGFTRRDSSVLACLRLVPSALVAALVAVVVTTVSSLWFPIGPVGPFEPDPGIRPDVAVLVAVALVALIAVLTVAAVSPYARRGRRRGPQAREGLADRLARRAPPSVAVGARMALPGDGLRTTMRTSVMTLAAGLLVAGAVVWLAAGVDRLANEPPRQGWAWDLTLLNEQGYRELSAPDIAQLLDTAGAEEWALLSLGDLQVDGAEIVTFGVAPERGSVDFTMLEGRMPSGPDEVALGKTTLEEIGASVGDTVELGGDDASRSAMIVGRVVLPALAPADAPRPRLGGGAVISQAGLELRDGPTRPTAVVINAQPGDVAALASRIVVALGEPTSLEVLREPLSGELRAWKDDLRRAPVLVVAAVALLAAAVLVHSLAVTARRRRRELAVLRALGMTGAGAAAALCSQALWLTGVAVVLGVPAGVLTAMIGWRYLAGNLGVAADAVWAVAPILALVASSLVLALSMSWVPSRRIRRDNIAEALRVE